MNRDRRLLGWIVVAIACAYALGYTFGQLRTTPKRPTWTPSTCYPCNTWGVATTPTPTFQERAADAMRRIHELTDSPTPTPLPAPPRHASRIGDVYRDGNGNCWEIDLIGSGNVGSTETTCPANPLRPPAWDLPNGAILETQPPALTFGGKDTAPTPTPTPTPCNCESAELR